MKQYRPLLITGGIILVLLGLGLFYSQARLATPSRSPKTQLFFSEQQKQVKVGATFSVDLMADPQGNSVMVVEPHITFDPISLQVTQVQKLDVYPNVLSTEQIQAGKATITVGSPSVSQPITKKSPVVRFTFKALRTSPNSVVNIQADSFVGSLSAGGSSDNMLASTRALNVRIIN